MSDEAAVTILAVVLVVAVAGFLGVSWAYWRAR